VIVQVKWKGYEKLAFSTNISLYCENGARYGHIRKTNRNSCAIYRMVPFPMTFNNHLTHIP